MVSLFFCRALSVEWELFLALRRLTILEQV